MNDFGWTGFQPGATLVVVRWNDDAVDFTLLNLQSVANPCHRRQRFLKWPYSFLEIAMKTRKHSFRQLILVTIATAALAVAATGTAQAEETEKSTSKHFSWNFNINFGNQSSFGTNRTKGSGVMKQETRPVANFSRLVLALPAVVTLSQGATESLTITTDDNLLPVIATRVESGELIIDADKSRGFSTTQQIKIRLVVRSLNGITIKGSGDVIGDELRSDKLDIAINGSGDVKFKSIRADEFKVTIKGSGDVAINALESKLVEAAIRGSGDIKLPSLQTGVATISVHGSGDVFAAGVADKVDVEIVGSGDVRTLKLIARETNVNIMASGDAEVHAGERLTATVSGSGSIRYAGSPASVSRMVRGSGTIKSL